MNKKTIIIVLSVVFGLILTFIAGVLVADSDILDDLFDDESEKISESDIEKYNSLEKDLDSIKSKKEEAENKAKEDEKND